MRRLSLIAFSAILLAAAAWLTRDWWSPGADLSQDARQNILLITIDTLRADALGCYGGTAATPVIDALAAAGLRFTFAHAHAVVTLPSHASILSGRYPFEHGLRENSGYRLQAGTKTLPQLLKARGLATGAFVGAFPLDARFGLTPGFDEYDGRFDDMAGAAAFALPERRATVVVERASRWIAAQRDQQWFAWVHVFDPHAPYAPPAPFDRDYASRPYAGEVAAVDRALAPLVEQLRGLSRATTVVVTSDHGEALGDHGETTHGLFAYEPTLRVPLIVSRVVPHTTPAAGRGETGAVIDTPAQHVDIMPTVLDLLAVESGDGAAPGRSLRTAESRAAAASRPSYFEAMSSMLQFGWAPLRGVVAGRDKYVDLPLPELYDLANDRGEQANLFDRVPERARVLIARLNELQASLPGAQRHEDPDVLARLRALGYVSGGAARKTTYTDADDPKRLVALDRALHEAIAHDEAGETERAMAKYREIIAARPDMLSAARHLAFDHWKRGESAAAIAALESAIRAGSATPGAQVQLATYLSDTGQTAKAVALLEPLTVGPSADLDAINTLAIAYARSNRVPDARKMFARGLAIDPGSAMIQENLGALALEEHDLSAARTAFERALASNPSSSQAVAGLAMVLFQSSDVRGALAQWRRAVDIDPTNFDALYNLAMESQKALGAVAARPLLERFVATAPHAQYGKDIVEIEAMLRRAPSK